ncbi:hypothetical protein DM860_017013 [Cuscuta australis]|uniref:Phytocyanin domain-containing protein n=1 Tax=Cuscuta australis TaxID=267555 RepID=A0A328DMT6_9ASTE|nr:hypothetical protein DM860_017013 [Cuscuta australis]
MADPSSQTELLRSLLLCFVLVSKLSQSVSVVVVFNGVSERKNSTVLLVGDTIIFRHHNVFLFKNQRAFNACNFTLAALLPKSNSKNYTAWHAVRKGFFHFSFSDGSNNTACLKGQKLAIEVTPSPPGRPAPSPGGSPPFLAGVGIAPSSPWARGKAGSPASAPVGAAKNDGPVMVPEEGGGQTPFIKSNPAVPLPTGEVDSATICTLPTSGHPQERAAGALTVQRAFFSAIFWMIIS